jgi:hypothetical protein
MSNTRLSYKELQAQACGIAAKQFELDQQRGARFAAVKPGGDEVICKTSLLEEAYQLQIKGVPFALVEYELGVGLSAVPVFAFSSLKPTVVTRGAIIAEAVSEDKKTVDLSIELYLGNQSPLRACWENSQTKEDTAVSATITTFDDPATSAGIDSVALWFNMPASKKLEQTA